MNSRLLPQKAIKYLLLVCLSLFFSGCGDELSGILDEGQTAMDSQRILTDASSLKKDPDIDRQAPEIYTRPSTILETTEGTKIFYFAKNKAPNDLAALIKAQMGVSVVNTHAGTNQLVVSCGSPEEAAEILAFIEKIDVPAIQIKIECMVIENYADFTMDRETRVKVSEFFGGDEGLVITGPQNDWGFFPGASLREQRRATYGMSAGYNSSDVKFLIDLLSSRGYLRVMMNPVLTTNANNSATIVSRDRVPIVRIVTGRDIIPYNITEYTWVEDILTVTPTVYADGSIGLATNIKFGSKDTPEGVVQNRIITERSINLQETRVPVGNSLIIGGFKKSEKFSVIRGFPFLKDLPLIGFMFSSKDFEERAKEITFIITPSIASKGIDFNDMVDKVEELHKTHKTESSITDRLLGIVTDPFSEGSYRGRVEGLAADDTLGRLEAEVLAAQTEREAEQARQRLAEYEQLLESGQQARTEAQKAAKSYADRLKEIEKAKQKLEESQKAELEKSQAEIAAAQAEYEKLVAQAEQSKQTLEEARQKEAQQQQQLQKATDTINKLIEDKKAMEAEKKRLEQRKQEAAAAAEKALADREARLQAEQQAKEQAEKEAAAAAAAERAEQEQAEQSQQPAEEQAEVEESSE